MKPIVSRLWASIVWNFDVVALAHEILYMPLPYYCLYNKMNKRKSIIKRVHDNEPTKLVSFYNVNVVNDMQKIY